MAKNQIKTSEKGQTFPDNNQNAHSISKHNALRDRNWGVLFLALVFLLSLVATIAVMLLTIGTRLDVIPAALLMVAVELWLIVYLPFYSRLAFWGGVIFIISFLFFALPFVALNLFPPYNAYAIAFIVISLVCFLIMFRERRLFLDKPELRRTRPVRR